MTDHDDEMDAILDLLEGAGLIEIYVNTDGRQAMRLTNFQPGWKVSRAADPPSSLTTSTRVLGGVRDSSGESNDL